MVTGDRPSTTVDTPLRASWTETEPIPLERAMAALEPVDAVWAAPDEPTIVTSGRVQTIAAGGEGRFESVRRQSADLFDRVRTEALPEPARPRLVGGFSFFGTDTLSRPWAGFEPASFSLPEVQIAITEDRTWITAFASASEQTESELETVLEATATQLHASETPLGTARGPAGESAQLVSESLRATEADWSDRVATITETIQASGLEKVVLAQGLDLAFAGEFNLGTVLSSLGEVYPSCHRFAFSDGASPVVSGNGRGPDGQRPADPPTYFLGASPERLVSKSGTDIATEALAGTVDRGETSAADEANAEFLREDPKIREEHDLVAREIEAQLDRIGESVRVGDRSIRKLATVQHLQAPIQARVEAGSHVLEVVEALHPTPAVGGRPPDAAMAVIREHDPVERGWYAAPFGWFDRSGDGTFAVGIRSGLVSGDRATLFAGNGIVGDSDPATEWDEVRLKFRPLRSALG